MTDLRELAQSHRLKYRRAEDGEIGNEPIPTRHCYVGKGHLEWWFSRHKHWVCNKCHRPAKTELVWLWHDVGEEVSPFPETPVFEDA